MKKIATLIAALTLAAPAFAAPETYNVDSTHTFARFSYSHFGMSTQLSKFNKTTGTGLSLFGNTSEPYRVPEPVSSSMGRSKTLD